ncbi:hypothetical protein Aduo_019998 [Ancylostoma duodenale]
MAVSPCGAEAEHGLFSTHDSDLVVTPARFVAEEWLKDRAEIRVKVLPSGLNLMATRLGPVTSGITRLVNITEDPPHTEEKIPEQLLSKLWDLEAVGIHDDPSQRSKV